MKKATAHDFVGEALVGKGIHPEGNASSDHTNGAGAGAGTGETAEAPSVAFTMDPKLGLTVEIVKKSKTQKDTDLRSLSNSRSGS